MVISFIHPTTCGFAKVIAWQLAKCKFPELQKKIARWNSRKINERVVYLATFDAEKWKKLTSSKKAEHSLNELCGMFTQIQL